MKSKQIATRMARRVSLGALALALTLAAAALAMAARAAPHTAATALNPPAAQEQVDAQEFPREFGGRRGPQRGRLGPPADLLRAPRRMAAALDLSEEQRDQLRDVVREIGDERRGLRRRISDARRALHRAARDPESNEAHVQELGAEVGRAQADQLLARRTDRDRILALLTEEQRERLEAMRTERREAGRRDRGRDRHRTRPHRG